MTITQADREVVALYVEGTGKQFDAIMAANIRRGNCDNLPLVQAVARHREASEAPLKERIAELEGAAKNLALAVRSLPVDEMVDDNPRYGVTLLGYCMQCQGEWDNVTQALTKINTLLGDG